MTMSADNTNSITVRVNKKWAWIAAGIVGVGIAGLNQEQQGPQRGRPGWNAPMAGYGGRPGFAPGGFGGGPQAGWNAPAMGGGMVAPQMGGYAAPAAGAGYGGMEVPTSGDS